MERLTGGKSETDLEVPYQPIRAFIKFIDAFKTFIDAFTAFIDAFTTFIYWLNFKQKFHSCF